MRSGGGSPPPVFNILHPDSLFSFLNASIHTCRELKKLTFSKYLGTLSVSDAVRVSRCPPVPKIFYYKVLHNHQARSPRMTLHGLPMPSLKSHTQVYKLLFLISRLCSVIRAFTRSWQN